MRVLIFALLVAACAASCPNDCNGNGVCNIYSACECYRNWMGADCSRRVCYFGHAFIDTPQGDLNSDGRVDRADAFGVEIISTYKLKALGTDDKDTAAALSDLTKVSAAQTAFAKTLTVAGNQYIDTSDREASDINNKGTVLVAGTGRVCKHTDGSIRFCMTVPVATNSGAEPTFADTEFLYALAIDSSYASEKFVEVEVAVDSAAFYHGTNSCPAAANPSECTSGKAKWQFVGSTGLTDDLYVYPTQFSNQKTWERYPENHGAAISANKLKAFWDEAHFYAECSGKGRCDRSTGTCECFVGYEGEGCTRTSCPGDCSGHGVCTLLSAANANYKQWDAEKTQFCDCDPGYKGIDCMQRICPSGDDPITRPAKESTSVDGFKATYGDYTESKFDAVDHLLPNANGQVAEIQVFGYTHALDITYDTDDNGAFTAFKKTNSFALEFTDEFGDKWVTKTLDWRTASAKDVEDVLEALPNKVLQNVQVGATTLKSDVTTYGVDTDKDCSTFEGESSIGNPCSDEEHDCCGQPRVWSVTFLTNTGNVAALGVRYKMNLATRKYCSGTADPADGGDCDMDSFTEATNDSAGKFCPAGCTRDDLTATSEMTDTDGAFYTLAACDENKMKLPCLQQQASDSLENHKDRNGMIALIGSDLLVQKNTAGDAYEYIDYSSTSDALTNFAKDPENRFYLYSESVNYNEAMGTADPSPTRYPAFITEARQGSQENVECSNRGLCDYESGLCKCFNGFTDDDCSVQNALAMY